MKRKVVIVVVILVLVLLGVKVLAEEFQGFLSFLTLFLSSLPSGASAPEVGLAAGIGVALFAFLLILLLFFAVAIIQFLLSRP
jgi:hypothetical protein